MEKNKSFRIMYILFLLPFFLCFLSWLYFPVFAEWIIKNIFRYTRITFIENHLWMGIVKFFYSWYTLIAIGLAGMWIVAAFIARKKELIKSQAFYPMVSFVIPAFNQEKNIANCIDSLFLSANKYEGLTEILVVDDGSDDCTYEIAWSTIINNRKIYPRICGKVIRHSVNLGKIDSLKTGINRAMGGLIAIVDSDSEWTEETLTRLVDYKLSNGKGAVTGYTHPNGEGSEGNFLVSMQRLEYSQGLGVGRCAQGLGDNVIVISGAIGVYDSDLLRKVIDGREIRSVTEDLEITLEMHKKGAKIGYFSFVKSATVAPTKISALWHQRLRWFTGWLHNTLSIHKDFMSKRSWVTSLIWYCYIFEFVGAIMDLISVSLFPFLLWFSPDPTLFIYNLFVFVPYGLFIGVISQAIALQFAYGKSEHKMLLVYTPFYPLLRIINVLARSKSIINYLTGNNGKWHKNQTQSI